MEEYVSDELFKLAREQFPADLDKAGGTRWVGTAPSRSYSNTPINTSHCQPSPPISAPTLCLWGKKAFTGYLGSDTRSWEKYDPHVLIQTTNTRLPLLVDQGSANPFLQKKAIT
jgi:S-formylglutathione hydrolase